MSRHVLITGSTGAIGSALAAEFLQREPDVRLTRVDVVGEVDVRWDLSQPGALETDWLALTAERGRVDVLVNCAGIMDLRSIGAMPWSDALRTLDIDLVSPLRLMSLCVRDLLTVGSGGVINISSMAGVTPLRGAVFYGAAKAGLAMASEVARLDLEPEGIHVLTVYPGPVRSALEKNARGQLRRTLLRDLMPTGDAAELARLIYQAFEQREARVVYPPLYDLANRVPRIAGWITSRLSPKPLL